MNLLKKFLVLIPFALAVGTMQAEAFTATLPLVMQKDQQSFDQLLASHSMSLNDRYPVQSVNKVFADNILLTLAYMSGTVKSTSQINWDNIHKPSQYVVTLQPGDVFSFHDDVLPEFAGKHIITTNAHFGAEQGFEYDGDLYGDGVCHFATLINWAA